MKTATIIVVIVTMLLVITDAELAEAAETFTIELPGLVGELEPYPNGSTAVFDFGTSFLSIDEVRIQMSGTFTLGSAHGDGVNDPVDQWVELPPDIWVYMDPGDGSCSTGRGLWESPFNIEEPFVLRYGASWDFLLDGKDQLRADLGCCGLAEEWVIVTLPTLQVSEAHLTIEGVVPEPATVFLLAMGIVGIRGSVS